MIEQQIESVLKNSLRKISKKNDISLQFLRIRMKLTEDFNSSYCTVFNDKEELDDIKWASILGLAYSFKSIIVDSITKNLLLLADKHGVDKEEINARYYAMNQKGDADILLYNGDTPIERLEINALI